MGWGLREGKGTTSMTLQGVWSHRKVFVLPGSSEFSDDARAPTNSLLYDAFWCKP